MSVLGFPVLPMDFRCVINYDMRYVQRFRPCGVSYRSMLFVPGDRPERVDRALASDADAVVIDLEDSVVPEHHAAARDIVQAKIRPGGIKRWVRILSFGTDEADRDLGAAIKPGLAGVVLPNIRDAATVRAADVRITELEAAADMPTGSVQLLPMLESALGLHDAFAILSASVRVRIGAFPGAPGGDLCTDLGVQTDARRHGALARTLASRSRSPRGRNGRRPR